MRNFDQAQDSNQVQEQVAMDVDTEDGVVGKANRIPGKEGRKVVRASSRKGGLVQTRIDGFLKLSEGLVAELELLANVCQQGYQQEEEAGQHGGEAEVQIETCPDVYLEKWDVMLL